MRTKKEKEKKTLTITKEAKEERTSDACAVKLRTINVLRGKWVFHTQHDE
jgi:hypothetical protein